MLQINLNRSFAITMTPFMASLSNLPMQKYFLYQGKARYFLKRGKVDGARYSIALENVCRQVGFVLPPVKEIGVSAVLCPQQRILLVGVPHCHAIANIHNHMTIISLHKEHNLYDRSHGYTDLHSKAFANRGGTCIGN